MKKLRNIIAILLCLILITLCTLTASAASAPNIILSNVAANPGDTVTIDISISNNPGIMVMSFCITYDNDALEYKGYTKGYLTNYTLKNHSDEGHIAFLNDESSDKDNDGIIISVKFKIKEDATPGKHIITLANQNRKKYGNKLHNSFSNSNLKYIVPTVTAGSITVGGTCENADHEYSAWEVVTQADCTHTGLKKHTCVNCGYSENAEISITHDFETEWTVDKAATPEEDGIMSRHCKNCDEVTDKITFSYEEIGGDDSNSSDNNSSVDVSSDNASSEESSNITNDDNNTGDTNSDVNSSSSENSAAANNTTSQNTSNNTANNQKPVINNAVGEKVPLQEVEKLEDYQQNIKPSLDNSASDGQESIENIPSENNSSDIVSSTPTDSNNTMQEKEPSFWATPMGIVMIVLSSLLSIGIIALGVILIIRNKKSDK